MKKKILALGVGTVLAASLVACGDGNTEETKTTARPAYVYVPEYFDWGVEEPENGYVNTYGVVNGYMLGMKSEWDNETGSQTQDILKYSIAEGTLETIPYVQENPNEYINTISVQPDGTIIACAEEYQWNEETKTGKSLYRVVSMDAVGQITNTIDLSDVCTEMAEKYDYVYIQNIAVDEEQVIYLTFEQEIVAVAPDGSKLFSVTTDNWIQSMGNMNDGSVYAVYYGQNGSEIGIIDKEAKGFGTKYELGNNNLNGFFNIAEDNMLYFSDSTSVRKLDLATGESEEVFQWLSVDINGQYVNGVNYLDENTFFAHYRDWSSDEEGFVKLVKTDSSLVPEKEILTMVALTSDSNIQEDVVAFNKANTAYRIELKTYLDYNNMSEADWENYDQFLSDATTRMINDITGKDAPDIISLSNGSISMATLANKGALEELTPYLEKAGYSEDDFIAGVVNSYKLDGNLYTLPERFTVQTTMADSAIVGEEEGWTLQEALEVIKNLPEGMSFSEYDTQEYFIRKCLMYGYTNFIDEQNASCNFDSDEFKAILEMAKTFPKEYDYSGETPATPILIQNGEVLTIEAGISSLEEVQVCLAYFGDKITPTFIGYPGVAGNGALLGSYGATYAVCSKSDNKDIAAEFIIEKITKPYEADNWRSWGFPSLKTELDAYITEQITVEYIKDENGELILDEEGNPIPENGGGSMGWGDWWYEYRPCTQEDADVLLALVDGIEGIYTNSNNTLFSMIMEEVGPFLNGQKTADEVAAVIQNRISLYLMENS